MSDALSQDGDDAVASHAVPSDVVAPDADALDGNGDLLVNYHDLLTDILPEFWREDIPFRDHFSRWAPTKPTPQAKAKGIRAKKTFRRTREPHLPLYLDHFERVCHADGTETLQESAVKRPSPHCRCHSCTGTRFQVFCLDLTVWAHRSHFANCIRQGASCNILCPGQPTSLLRAASLTIDHLEFAEQQGFNINAILTGVGFGPDYQPPGCWQKFTPVMAIEELYKTLYQYKNSLHGPFCSPSTPCRT